MSKIKRKGAYDYEKEWHQDASCLVVPKVAEQVLLFDKPLRETLYNWSDKMDFMIRRRVPRGSTLELCIDNAVIPMDNTLRYYVSTSGGRLVKTMPPLPGKEERRRFDQEKGWKVWPCNDISTATAPIDYRYYEQEIEKLTLGVM